MQVIERVRALPRRQLVAGLVGLGLVLVIVVVSVAAGGGDGRADDAVAGTTLPRPASTGVVTEAPAATSTTRPPTGTTTTTTTTLPDTDGAGEIDDLDVDDDDPAVVARPIPGENDDSPPPTTLAPPPWAASTRVTSAGYLAADVGCAADVSAQSLDDFFAQRVGPSIGWDYQHVYPLGGDRYLWLFQDAFLDHTGVVGNLGRARFAHNAGLLQTGSCFTLLHRGTADQPEPFETGDGLGDIRTKWFWPMGGDLGSDGKLWVFWAEMVKDNYDPQPPDGLGWHPNRTFLAAYDTTTLERTAFFEAPNPGVVPIYGYAVASDETHTYLFGNTFEQNLVREGGFWNGPHSATSMWLARVPRGRLAAPPEYRTADGWSPLAIDAVPIDTRYYVENPMQPRYRNGQWIAATAVNGYWGDELAIDVAPDPWGPWTTVEYFHLQPRNNDPLMNTYHAHLLPWGDAFGSSFVTISNNARNMLRDAWPRPDRYRPMVIFIPYHPTPAPTTTTTTLPPTTTSSTTTLPPTTTSTTTPPPATTSTTTTVAPTTTVPPTSTSTTTTLPPTTTTTTVPTTTTTLPPTTTTTTVG